MLRPLLVNHVLPNPIQILEDSSCALVYYLLLLGYIHHLITIFMTVTMTRLTRLTNILGLVLEIPDHENGLRVEVCIFQAF